VNVPLVSSERHQRHIHVYGLCSAVRLLLLPL